MSDWYSQHGNLITGSEAASYYTGQSISHNLFLDQRHFCIRCNPKFNNGKLCETCKTIEKLEKEIEQLKKDKNKLKCIIMFTTSVKLNKDVVKNIYDFM